MSASKAAPKTAPERAARQWRTPVGIAIGVAALLVALVLWGGGLADGLAHGGGLTTFLVAVAVVLTVCHVCGELAKRIGQPAVLGEIVGGLLLGPSALGWAAPEVTAWLFSPAVLVNLDRAAQLGLLIFMFLLGCELRTEQLRGAKVMTAVVSGSLFLPLAAGVVIALLAGDALAGPAVGTIPAGGAAHVAFFGIAIAITAMPVLGRILVDLGIERTRIGAVALSAAAIGDGVAWTALAVILAVAGIGGVPWATTAGLAIAFTLFVFLCVRPALAALDRRLGEHVLLVVLVVGAIASGAVAELIGLHPVLGAFLFGVAVPRRSEKVERIGTSMRGFAVAILLPLFFAGVGLKTMVGLFGSSWTNWVLFAAVLVFAVGTKVVGAGVGARLAGLPPSDALRVGWLMNCRGITELVVATIGLQSGLLSPLGFTILVLMAVITTALTGPTIRRLERRADATPTDSPATPPATATTG